MIGLAELMGGVTRCLWMSQRNEMIYNLVQRIRGGFRVKTTRFRLQRWSHLEETHLAKRAITDIR
jgi:hypothetical protein